MVGNRVEGRILQLIVLVPLLTLLAGNRAFAQNRGGFTGLVDIGVGVQNDTSIEETAAGFAGLSGGVGAFLTRDFALMFRLTGTSVSYDFGAAGDYGQTSGVVGPTIQYWISDRFNIEAGAGWGFWRGHTDEDETGLGLILGAGVTIFNRGKHNLQFGVQYSPAFTDPGTIHNVGFTLGYQFL
jgi:Outer membrane protein beta-barrel domain